MSHSSGNTNRFDLHCDSSFSFTQWSLKAFIRSSDYSIHLLSFGIMDEEFMAPSMLGAEKVLSDVATNVLHPTGSLGPSFLHQCVPKAAYKIATLSLNIN